jgi:DNA-directed RNA polymerase specialized sigma24 family protein
MSRKHRNKDTQAITRRRSVLAEYPKLTQDRLNQINLQLLAFINEYGPNLHAYVRVITKDSPVAGDLDLIIQNVLILVWRQLLEDHKVTIGWACLAARWHYLKLITPNSRLTFLNYRDIEAFESEIDPDIMWNLTDFRYQVKAALKLIEDEQDRDIIEAVIDHIEINGLRGGRYQRVAEKFKINVDQVRFIYRKHLPTIQAYLRSKGWGISYTTGENDE